MTEKDELLQAKRELAEAHQQLKQQVSCVCVCVCVCVCFERITQLGGTCPHSCEWPNTYISTAS